MLFDATASSVNLPALIQADNTDFDIGIGGVVNAPNLTIHRLSAINLDSTATLNVNSISDFDGTVINLTNGATFGSAITASSYNASPPGVGQIPGVTLFSSEGNGTSLDLSSLTQLTFGRGDGFAATQTIRAVDNGHIDLSGLQTIRANSAADTLVIRQSTGGTIDLTGLEVIDVPNTSNRVLFDATASSFDLPALASASNARFEIGVGQAIHMPNLMNLSDSDVILLTGGSATVNGIVDFGSLISVADITSSLTLNHVQFRPSSSLSVPTAATVVLRGDLLYNMTNEADLGIDDAIMLANGGAVQLLEVGGQDLGVGGATSQNFGIGQLVIGEAGGPVTIVELSEVFDNGNRGPMGLNGEEALYLYGLGGPDGLRIEGGSILALNSINVYAWDGASGQQVHLNSLFGPGDFRIPYGNGFLQLGLDGDFDGDNLYSCGDIDELISRIAAGDHDEYFDLTGDGQVTLADRDRWLTEAGAATLASGNAFLLGDANLDGNVDGADFLVWNSNKFTSAPAWCSGDFNADGVVDGVDFLTWNANKFQSADSASAVPEPSSQIALMVVGLAVATYRRQLYRQKPIE